MRKTPEELRAKRIKDREAMRALKDLTPEQRLARAKAAVALAQKFRARASGG